VRAGERRSSLAARLSASDGTRPSEATSGNDLKGVVPADAAAKQWRGVPEAVFRRPDRAKRRAV